MELKKIRKLTVKSKKKLDNYLSDPIVSNIHPLWKSSKLMEEAIEIIDACLSGENLRTS